MKIGVEFRVMLGRSPGEETELQKPFLQLHLNITFSIHSFENISDFDNFHALGCYFYILLAISIRTDPGLESSSNRRTPLIFD